MKQTSLKLKIYGLLTVYILAWLLQSRMPFFQSDIFANTKKPDTNIIALIVDKDLYRDKLKDSIDRYATQYIQQKISNSRAVIFPINTTTIHARDITKMLENIYHDGIEKEPSTLKGVILVGNKIPLPVVNDNGATFPTIFPYTDFDDAKYYRDPKTQFFVPNNNPKTQAEIRQSIINVGHESDNYITFFKKLKQYTENPKEYVGDKIRYDDFIDQKSSFNKTNLTSYINKFIFAEDFGYHRYNPIAINLFNKKNNKKTELLTEGLGNLSGEVGSYANQVGSVFSGLLADYNNNSGGNQANTIPTVFVDDALKGFQKSYQELYGVTSIARMRDNILAAGRRDIGQIDSHASKIEYYDQLYTKSLGESRVPLLVEINKKLEDTIIDLVKQKQYPLRIGIPVHGTIEKHAYTKLWSGGTLSPEASTSFGTFFNTVSNNIYPNRYYNAGIYEAFYYGRNASTITGIDQTSIFLGTPNPIDNNINNIGNTTGVDSHRGIGSSQGVLSQFVEANRGYATEKTLIDHDMAGFNAGICDNNFENYRDGYLGGNTPLNLTGANDGLQLKDKRYDRGGIANWIINNTTSLGTNGNSQAGSILNIAGSKKVGIIQPWMFANNMQGGFLQRIAFEDIEYHPSWLLGNVRKKVWKKVDTCILSQTDAEPLTAHDITNTTGSYQTGYAKYFKINGMPLLTSAVPCPSNPVTGSACYPIATMLQIPAGEYLQKQELNYKTIDSLSIHNAPNEQQIKELKNTTPDRPIDSVRYLSFRGIGGDEVRFEFPNFYNIPVYKESATDSGNLILQSPYEITQNIRQYLQNIIIEYNNRLTSQITKQPNYFNTHSTLFATLGVADPLATPARPYTLIDTNLLNTIINDELVSTIAQILYTENSLLAHKKKTTNLGEELDQIESLSNITNKKKTIIENYIIQQTPTTPLSLPGYQKKGYELISLTSNGDDSVTSIQEPEVVRLAQDMIDEYETYQSSFTKPNANITQDGLKDACASKYGEPVPLVDLGDMSFPWFDMFACRLQRIGTPKVTFDFKNAQGPVLTDGFFKDFVKNAGSDEQYNVSDSDLSKKTYTNEEKEIIDALSITISPKSYLLNPDTPISLQPQITIEHKDISIGSLDISLSSTGNNCTIIDKKNLCNQSYTTILGVSSKPLILPITLETKKSGHTDITIKACKANTPICATQTYSISIIPSVVNTIKIITPYDTILQASPVPITLQAKDKYNNTIPFSLMPYTLSTSTGTLQGAKSTVLANFRDIQELQGPNNNDTIISNLTITDKNKTLIGSKKLSFAPGKIKIVSEDNFFDNNNNNINYVLPKKKSLVSINKEYTNISLLPKLTLELHNKINGESLAGPVIVTSEYGMFDMYRIDGFGNTIIANTGLELTNTLIFNGKKEHIVIKPKGKSGTDIVKFLYPDGSEEKITINIIPSPQAAQIKIIANDTTNNNILANNSTSKVTLYVYDDRGNTMTAPTLIKSEAYGALSFSGQNTKTTLIPAGGTISLTIQTQQNGGPGYLISKILNNNQTIPGLWKTKVAESIIPQGNLNGLYLNIMGTDRGNTTTENNNAYNFIPNIFIDSDKLLATTTQLTDPSKIQTQILQILPNGNTIGKEINDRIVVQRDGKIVAQNIVQKNEIIVGTRDDFAENINIQSSSIIYPNNTNIIKTLSWSAGSTNSEKIITLIDKTSIYTPDKNPSVEESIDPNNNIGRRHNQEHLTQFGQGKSIGEATMTNASEFLVNYGDPLITRVSNNLGLSGTTLDDGPGQVIVHDPTRTIIKSLSIDINNDGLKDIVTVFSNGDVIWSKHYGGKQIFVDMGPLLKIFGTIHNVFGVNAQGDGFDDIMVESENHTLRIYTNTLGIFDVDGFPVCINTQQQPENSVTNIDQRFVEDMDNDGLSDVITNQEGQIKIIYGGSTTNGHSYISQYHDSCDQNRQDRQKSNTKTIETLATQLGGGNIVDNSLLRRKGLIQTSDSISASGNVEDTTINSNIENQIKLALTSPIPNFNNLPLQEITNQASANLMRRSVSPIDYMPRYEILDRQSIRYISTSQLTPQDQVRVYKKYQDINGGILQKNDKVKVTVSILGLRNEAMTYIDRIQGPWIVKMDNNGIISGRDNGTLPPEALYKSISPQGGFMFVVDNITLGGANATEFSYQLTYQGGASTKIKIADRNNDEYKDIAIYPLDGCSKFLRTFINNKSFIKKKRDYEKTFIDLEKKLSNYNTITQQNSQNYISGMTNTIQNIAIATGSNANTINTLLNNAGSEQMTLGNFLNNTLQEGGTSMTLNLNAINNIATAINTQVRDAIAKLCGGNKDGGQSCGSGLPIPFNMAFLSPGEFNIMGCKPKVSQIDNIFPKDSGFPVFAFPATFTLPTPTGLIPIPLPFPFGGLQKGIKDEYGYFGIPLNSNTPQPTPYSSIIRIYLSPTLTQQMGMAICMGPQTVGSKIPAPFNVLGGNCIVTKVNMPNSSCNEEDASGAGSLSDQDLSDLSEFGTCTQGKAIPNNNLGTTTSQSPFKLVSYNNNILGNPFPDGTYFGIINFEKTPIVLGEENTNEGVVLQGGKEIQPQIQGGNKKSKGLVACIVNDRLDRQTNYIINNFTNMQIGVYLPDLSQMGEGFENLGAQLNSIEDNTGSINKFFSNFGSSGDGIASNSDTFSGNLIQKMRNYTINQSSLKDLSDGINNPFDQLAKMFDQTPLIHISTIDVPVHIPMIYAEDITKYEAYLKTRKERNKQTIKDRETIVQGTLGICGKNYDMIGNSSTTSEQLPTLDKKFFDDLYKKLKEEKNKIKEKIEKKKTLYKERKACKDTKRDKNNDACKKIMSTMKIDDKGLKDIDTTLDGSEKINTQCINFLFDNNGDIQGNLKNLFSIMKASDNLETNIRINLKTLDQYKRFPLQLYQWIHVVDRYLSEITTTVDNFLGSLTLWLHTNATRFEQYVDAIITISTALQTWQAILDLSVDWQKKCSTCTVDNYDAYACSLGFLCGKIKLPILKLPPFKIPNIYIDLSHIDVGMDINLPKFQFIPTSVPLIELPNLPQPPNIVLGNNITDLEKISLLLEQMLRLFGRQIPLSIPIIPLLPSPPTLPELPSFIPNINIELPVLPPAPKIPKIAPEIETVIKAVSFFSELYCIVKGGVGLVGESNVKTRIEQLTQRTYEIPLFDNINLSKDMSYEQDKLEGFDFQIDAYVNFTMNFNGVYSLIKGLADSINSQTKKITQRDGAEKILVNQIDTFIEKQTNDTDLQDIKNLNDLNNTTQQNINLKNPLGMIGSDKGNPVSVEQKNINTIAQFLINDSRTPIEKKKNISGLVQRINQKAKFIPDNTHILALQQEVHNSITASRTSLDTLAYQIKDYGQFIDQLQYDTPHEYTLYSGKSSFSTNLFDGDKKILQKNNNNIMKDYIGLQKTLLSHYKKGLAQVTNNNNKDMVGKINKDINYLEKGLDISDSIYSNHTQDKQQLIALHETYDAEKNLIYNNQAATCNSLGNLTTTDNTTTLAQQHTTSNTYPYFGATAQIGGSSSQNTSPRDTTTNLYDFSEYKNKIMIPTKNSSSGAYVNVVRSDYFTNNNKGYEYIDMNNDETKDLMRRDNNTVWIKYGNQNNTHILPINNTTQSVYSAPVWESPDQRKDDTTDGYLHIDNLNIKVYNKDRSVKNLHVRAEDYDSFTVSWTNSERQQPVEGYILEINKIPDLYHVKGHNDVPTALQSRYVLFVPKGKNNTEGYLSIHNQLNTKAFENLLTGTVLDIVEYNTTSNTINYSFVDIPRAWYYTRVASLQTQGDTEQPIYSLSSARSHHVVAGQQIIADTQGPSPDIQLQRVLKNTIVDTGLSPQGLVNTRYNIQIKREDPNGVIENWIETSTGQKISQLSGETNILSGLYFNQKTIQNYRIGARDHNNNITREQLNLTINVPTISLDDIIYENTPNNGINILSSITQGMDDGIVKFERKRNNIRTLLSNNQGHQGFNYPLTIDQTTITGGLYNQSQNVSFFAPNGDVIATFNKTNGSLGITPQYSHHIIKRIDLKSNTPVITLYDTKENRDIFTIKTNTKNPQLITQAPYEIINLSGAIYGGFAGGTCIRGPEHNCMIIAAPNGLIVIPAPYHTSLMGNYSYENTLTTIHLTNPTGESVGSVSFNAFMN